MTDEKLTNLEERLVNHTITRTHALYLALFTIVVCVASAYGTYLTTIGDLRRMIEGNERSTDAKIAQLRLERESTSVKKEELTQVTKKLDDLTVSLATLHGLIQGQNQGRGSNSGSSRRE